MKEHKNRRIYKHTLETIKAKYREVYGKYEENGGLEDKIIYNGYTESVIPLRCRECGKDYTVSVGHLFDNRNKANRLCASCFTRKSHTMGLDKFKVKIRKVIFKSCPPQKLIFSTYRGNRVPMKLVCPIHGEWEREPKNLLMGRGCPKCGITKRSISSRLPYKEFLKRARIVHSSRYEYPEEEYWKEPSKAGIICHTHGIFYQNIDNHLLQKQNCPKCMFYKNFGNKPKPVEEFIKDAIRIHGDKYEYKNAIYLGKDIKLLVTCRKHGDFYVRPTDHLSHRSGCPKCSASEPEVRLMHLFERMHITYIYQFSFPDSRYTYDFFLPEYNILIEYNGRQHYKPIAFFGGREGLKSNRKRDRIKNLLARTNNIDLLKIKYTKYKILEQYFIKQFSKRYPYHFRGSYYKSTDTIYKSFPNFNKSQIDNELSDTIALSGNPFYVLKEKVA